MAAFILGVLSTAGFASVPSLTSDSAVLRIISPVADSDFARPLAAGDLDGDGADDIIIGQSDSVSDYSTAYVIRGKREGWNFSGPRVVNLATEQADKVIQGEDLTVNLPTSIAVGDVNGDGIADLVLSASSAQSPGRLSSGVVYIVLGSSTFFDSPATLTLTAPTGASVITLYGPTSYGDTGAESAFGGMDAHAIAIGDLNGDGIGDLAIGTHLASPLTRGTAGQVSVLYGRTSFANGQTFDLASANIQFYGARTYYETGTNLLISDFTGDGIGDLVIGCPVSGEQTFYLSQEGIVYVFKGRPTAAWATTYDLRTATPEVKMLGRRDGDGLGADLAAVDINRDGVNDLCIGESGAGSDPSLSDNFGGVMILFGGSTFGNPAQSLNFATATPSLEWSGPDAYSNMGAQLTSGKFEKSGVSSLASAAYFAGADTNGYVELLDSRASWTAGSVIKSSADQNDFRLIGPVNGRYGFALTSGDTNGDGLDEIIVGAPFHGDGEVHVFQLDRLLSANPKGWTLFE